MADDIVVLASCVCDLFHIGHLNYLRRAAALGDFLVVGVVTDELLLTFKGKPTIPFEERFQIVLALGCVDVAYARENFDDRGIVKKYGVSIRAVGPEYGEIRGQRANKKALEELGVRFVVVPRTPNISTTMIRRRIKDEEDSGSISDARFGGLCVTTATLDNLGVVASRSRRSRGK